MSGTTREKTGAREGDDQGHDHGQGKDDGVVAAQVTASRSPVRCPYCHDACGPDDPRAMVCQQCLSRHHAGCWSEGGGRCASCASTRALQPTAPAIVVSPAELTLLRVGAGREAVERLMRRVGATDADARAALLEAACRELAKRGQAEPAIVTLVKLIAMMIVAIVTVVMIFG